YVARPASVQPDCLDDLGRQHDPDGRHHWSDTDAVLARHQRGRRRHPGGRPRAARELVRDMPDDAINDQESTGAATEPREPESQESPLDALRREKDALQDRLLRTAAEFDNYRKRVDRDRRDQAEAATADALADLLPIV